jgi:AmmeMemoRadiSam system protein A
MPSLSETALSEADRRGLLRLARYALVQAVSRALLPQHIPVDGIFAKRCGAFVTLHVQRRLRGCIGVIEAEESLGDIVVRCAASAALQDPRFPPIRAEELGDLRIEISLLAQPLPIRLEEIEIGSHGLLITHGSQRGLLLPQVAVEHRLAREQFAQETCRKAQLPPDAWKDAWKDSGVQMFGFTCQVFAEDARAVGV